jgi:hypothetical protein
MTFSMIGRCAGETPAAYTRRAWARMEDLAAEHGTIDWRPFGGGQALFTAESKEMIAYVNTAQMGK